MTEESFKNKLSPEAYQVCRLGDTEPAFSGKYCDHFELGLYHCACCDAPLFKSVDKFTSGCGWPSFKASIADRIDYCQDVSHGMIRIEIKCLHCHSHLGHVFEDGPAPTNKRYCVNSLSLLFRKECEQ